MKNIDEATRLSVELAKLLITEMRTHFPNWIEAFLRVQFEPGMSEIKCSYVLPHGVEIMNALKHKSFTRPAMELAQQLQVASSNNGRLFCVLLLHVDSKNNYKFQYEYENGQRWSISKINGGTGLPQGYVPA